jgi:LmbE family N-acetylglucosaminyl deacetylase
MTCKAVLPALSLCALSAGALGTVPARINSPSSNILIDAGARVLVVAPHPDDELLGAGGLIQHARTARAAVRVVYLTDGEAYTAGVEAEERRSNPSASDYREYGRLREREARAALKHLGVDSDALSFLGFPNNGLGRLMTTYWSDRRAAFLSPYTRRDRPRSRQTVLPDTRFRGEDLTQELAAIIGTFEPTLIVVPRKEDQHVDHCAAWYFVGDALGDVRRVHPAFRTELLAYIVHFNTWPFEDEVPRLPPPPGLSSGRTGWLVVNLTAAQTAAKREALRTYVSQMKVMDWFLMGFARTNEIFSRPLAPRIVLPVRRDPCGMFTEPVSAPRR